MPTISKEDYLKAIYSLELNQVGNVSTTILSKKLMVSNSAATDMSKKLASQNLIIYQPYKGLSLTKKGKYIATQIIRRHRLWELFLVNVLNLSWDKVHDEAEQLEHSTSEFLIDSIEGFLGYPKFDPHGEPIPDKKGVLPELPPLIILANAEVGRSYEIFKLNDESSDLIKYLSSIGIALYKKVKVVSKLKFDKSMVIEIGAQKHSLSEKISDKISVTILEKEEK